MNMKRVAAGLALSLCVVLLACMVVGVTVQAAGGRLFGEQDPSTSGSGNGGTGSEGGIVMEGYSCMADWQSRNPINQITPGMGFVMEVRITDKRPGIENTAGLLPQAYLNTSSFIKSYATDTGADANITLDSYNAQTKVRNYTLMFPLQYTGTGKSFGFDLHYGERYGNNTGLDMYSFNITLNQCVEKVDPSSSHSEDSSDSGIVRGTGFVLKSASYGGGNIQAGGSFTLNATMLSTNGSQNVENVYVSITPAKEIALADGNSVVYIGTVAPNQEVPVSFLLEAGNVESEGTYKVTLDVKGINATSGEAVSAQMDIAVPIVFSERFEITNVNLPEFLTAGGMDGGYASVSLVNKGKGAIHNVTATIEGDGLSSEEGNQFVGNINAGSESVVDFTLLAQNPGEVNGQILITYEDAKGNEKNLRHAFTVTVEEAVYYPDSMIEEPVEEPQTGLPGWAWVLIVLGVLAVAGVVLGVVLKKRKAKRNAALLDDYTEDENP